MSRLRKIIGLALRVIPDPPPPPPPPDSGSGGGGTRLHSDPNPGTPPPESGGGNDDTHSGGEEWSTAYTTDENGVLWQIIYHNGNPVSRVRVSG